MSDELRTLDPNIISSLVINGDLKRLTPEQKVAYYNYRCQQAGLDPSAKPFDLLTLNNKEILYANAGCSQQLTSIHGLSHQITGRELTDGIYCVFCRVTGPDGRSTENMGAVPVENLKGEMKSNAMLKATTKAIRRSVLAHMGLGMMDEAEVETIPGAVVATLPTLITTPTTGGWSIEEQETFAMGLEALYRIFKAGGHPEMYTKEEESWKERKKNDPAPVVLKALEERVNTLETAANAAIEKAKAKVVANPTVPTSTPAPMTTPKPVAPNQAMIPTGDDDPGPLEPVGAVEPVIAPVVVPDDKETASEALKAACERFERQYRAQNLDNAKGLTLEMRDRILKGMKFNGDESAAQKKILLAQAMQEKANLLKIP